MTRNNVLLLAPILLLCVGCSADARSALGLYKSAPDEFTVISNPPLKEPPVFSMTQPASQEVSIIGLDSQERGVATVHNRTLTQQERAFIEQLGATHTSAVKADIDKEHSKDKAGKASKGVVSKAVSKLHGEATDPVVDPIAERDRIKENATAGKAINEGTVQEKSPKSTLQRLFE